jgi:citrate synthase
MDYLTAEQAAEALKVSAATLYAYVSRGLIQSVGTEGDGRKRLYSAADVRRLLAKRESRKEPEAVAERALDWGAPVVESAITLITGGDLYYRGYRAADLALTRTVAEVAALIWTGEFETEGLDFTAVSWGERETGNGKREMGNEKQAGESGTLPFLLSPFSSLLSPVEQFQTLLPSLAAADPTAYDLRRATLIRTGARLVATLFEVSGFGASLLYAPPNPLTIALILCADHELNVSTFTARCIASSGAPLYGVVNGALNALQGMRHGGQTLRVAALLREAESVGVRRAISERLARGDAIPGFGHRLYPQGDPRGRLLLALTTQIDEDDALTLVREVVVHVQTLMGEYPTIDLGLVAVERLLGLPHGSALTLFALGRLIGWIGQALEEYERGQLIRPRAHYVGVRVRGNGAESGTQKAETTRD